MVQMVKKSKKIQQQKKIQIIDPLLKQMKVQQALDSLAAEAFEFKEGEYMKVSEALDHLGSHPTVHRIATLHSGALSTLGQSTKHPLYTWAQRAIAQGVDGCLLVFRNTKELERHELSDVAKPVSELTSFKNQYGVSPVENRVFLHLAKKPVPLEADEQLLAGIDNLPQKRQCVASMIARVPLRISTELAARAESVGLAPEDAVEVGKLGAEEREKWMTLYGESSTKVRATMLKRLCTDIANANSKAAYGGRKAVVDFMLKEQGEKAVREYKEKQEEERERAREDEEERRSNAAFDKREDAEVVKYLPHITKGRWTSHLLHVLAIHWDSLVRVLGSAFPQVPKTLPSIEVVAKHSGRPKGFLCLLNDGTGPQEASLSFTTCIGLSRLGFLDMPDEDHLPEAPLRLPCNGCPTWESTSDLDFIIPLPIAEPEDTSSFAKFVRACEKTATLPPSAEAHNALCKASERLMLAKERVPFRTLCTRYTNFCVNHSFEEEVVTAQLLHAHQIQKYLDPKSSKEVVTGFATVEVRYVSKLPRSFGEIDPVTVAMVLGVNGDRVKATLFLNS